MGKTRKIIVIISCLIVGGFGIYRIGLDILAEQSGSSPESGSDSRLKTASTAIAALGYGSTASGAWGDWGTMWNRVYSAAQGPFNDSRVAGLKNGTGAGSANCTDTFALNCYTKAKGGVDDYNNNNSTPSDAYYKTWTTCNSGNSYCGTNRSVAEKQDPNTGLVWSPRISTALNWFDANNCLYPNGLPGDDGACGTAEEIACYCVKKTSSKTGCENYDDGNWRLPYQKEFMQAYIDGSWENLTNVNTYYWSGTTYTPSGNTHNAWHTFISNGYTTSTDKTVTNSVRCVR